MSEELYSEPQVQSQSAPSKSVFAALCPLVASVALLCLSAGITVAMLAKSQRGFFALAGVSGLLALVAGLLSILAGRSQESFFHSVVPSGLSSKYNNC